jgi:hypothetical protein
MKRNSPALALNFVSVRGRQLDFSALEREREREREREDINRAKCMFMLMFKKQVARNLCPHVPGNDFIMYFTFYT